MSFQSELKNAADLLLEELGEVVSIQRVTEGAYVPSTGAVGAGSTITYTVYGAPSNYTSSDIDDDLVQMGDVKLIVQVPDTYVPLVGDVATLNSKAYRVMSVTNYRAQGGYCAFILQLRV